MPVELRTPAEIEDHLKTLKTLLLDLPDSVPDGGQFYNFAHFAPDPDKVEDFSGEDCAVNHALEITFCPQGRRDGPIILFIDADPKEAKGPGGAKTDPLLDLVSAMAYMKSDPGKLIVRCAGAAYGCTHRVAPRWKTRVYKHAAGCNKLDSIDPTLRDKVRTAMAKESLGDRVESNPLLASESEDGQPAAKRIKKTPSSGSSRILGSSLSLVVMCGLGLARKLRLGPSLEGPTAHSMFRPSPSCQGGLGSAQPRAGPQLLTVYIVLPCDTIVLPCDTLTVHDSVRV
jgi:hypothetical protein